MQSCVCVTQALFQLSGSDCGLPASGVASIVVEVTAVDGLLLNLFTVMS